MRLLDSDSWEWAAIVVAVLLWVGLLTFAAYKWGYRDGQERNEERFCEHVTLQKLVPEVCGEP